MKALIDQRQEWLTTMQSLLHYNVPRFIMQIIEKGGVSSDEWKWLQLDGENPDSLAYIINRADEYLLYPKNRETFEKSLFALVLGLSIMSFIPGGIRFFGLRFSSELENFVDDEG